MTKCKEDKKGKKESKVEKKEVNTQEGMIRFINLISLSGNVTLNQILLNFGSDRIDTLSKSLDGSVGIKAELRENPTGLNGKVGLQDITKLKSYLEMLGGKVKFALKENKLQLSNGKKNASTLLKKPEFVETNVEPDKYKKLLELIKDAQTIEVATDDLNKLEDYCSLTQVNVITLILANNSLTMKVGSDNTDEIVDKLDVKYEGKEITIKLGSSFLDAIRNLDGTIKLSLKEKYPIKINYNRDKINFEAIVAQIG